MAYYLLKLVVSAGIIVAVSEIAKMHRGLGALINALPLVSLLAMVWLYVETRDARKIAELSSGTFWLVLPTLPMFLVLPALLKAEWGLPGTRSGRSRSPLRAAPLLFRCLGGWRDVLNQGAG